jgi:hypothetical protein
MYIYEVLIVVIGRIPYHFVILLTVATIIMGMSTVSMLIPQAAYASTDGADRSSSSDDDDEDCGSDELPASIDGTIRCMGPRECYSSEFEFDGERVKHCNFMTSNDK